MKHREYIPLKDGHYIGYCSSTDFKNTYAVELCEKISPFHITINDQVTLLDPECSVFIEGGLPKLITLNLSGLYESHGWIKSYSCDLILPNTVDSSSYNNLYNQKYLHQLPKRKGITLY
jgi:hypothetical protein